MRHAHTTSGQLSVAERTDAADRLAGFFRQKHPVKTAENVAADANLNAETVQKWLDRGSMPSAMGLLYLVCAYGPELLCALYGADTPAWLTTAHQGAELARVEAELAALERRRAALLNR